jgi:hypothetical protein
LLQKEFTNTTLGRNLFDPVIARNRFRYSSAFISDPDEKKDGIVCDSFYFRKSIQGETNSISSIRPGAVRPARAHTDSIARQLNEFTDAYYETARYLLYHNKKRQ